MNIWINSNIRYPLLFLFLFLPHFLHATTSAISEYTNVSLKFSILVFIWVVIHYLVNHFDFLNKVHFAKITNDFLVKNIKELSNQDDTKWKEIVTLIESTHHTSILSKIKDLESEDQIKLEKYQYKHDFQKNYLHKIEVFITLFEVIYEKLHHKIIENEIEDNNILDNNIKKNLSEYKEYMYKKIKKFKEVKYTFKILLIISNISSYIIPFIGILLLMFIIDKCAYPQSFLQVPISQNPMNFENNYFNFFFGIAVIFLSLPFLLIIDNMIRYSFIKINIKQNLILSISYMILLAFLFTYIIIQFGFTNIEHEGTIFHEVFNFFKYIIFHTEPTPNFIKLFSTNENNIKNIIFILEIIVWLLIISIIYMAINYFYKQYDQFYYEQKIKKYLLPPELFKIISIFTLVVFSLGYLYIIIIDHTPRYSTPISPVINKELIISQLQNELNEANKLSDILPFSIFLALLGTMLAIATKDIMENYFTGLSMKINPPYEEGDRVRIGSYTMLEVRELGTRDDKFYEISTNSIISIPHKKLAQLEIKNYTHPTLDYRSEVIIYVKDEEAKLEKNNIPREAEKVLLTSAFINTGVKLPQIKIKSELRKLRKTLKRTKNMDEKEKLEIKLNQIDQYYRLLLVSLEEYRELQPNLNVDIEKNNEKIEEIWKVLTDLNKVCPAFFKKLFINNLTEKLINNDENLHILIKKTIVAIVISVFAYQDKIIKKTKDEEAINKLCISYDKNGIRRKHNMFENIDLNLLKDFSTILVDISFYYYMLSNRLWELKETQSSLIQKRKIDQSMTQILNVPRVTSSHELNDGRLYWKVKLLVTLELSEQSDETIHHINMYINKLWTKFLARKLNLNENL